MTDPDPVAPAKSPPGPSRTWPAPRTQFSFDKNAQVHPCSSQVVEPKESVLPLVLEELRDDVFTPSPSSQPSRAVSTTAVAPLTRTRFHPRPILPPTLTAGPRTAGDRNKRWLHLTPPIRRNIGPRARGPPTIPSGRIGRTL